MPEDREEPEECPGETEDELTYPDGSPKHECWAEQGYTRRRQIPGSDEDLSVLRGD